MSNEFKNDEEKKLNETKKEKKKLILAKDKKEGALAIIVVLVFLANSAYMLGKYISEQRARTTASQEILVSPGVLPSGEFQPPAGPLVGPPINPSVYPPIKKK